MRKSTKNITSLSGKIFTRFGLVKLNNFLILEEMEALNITHYFLENLSTGIIANWKIFLYNSEGKMVVSYDYQM